MKTLQNNGQATATANASESNNRRTQYDEVTKIIRISFEHDGRMNPEDAREYVAERVHSYATAHAHTIDEGTHILNVESEDPEPQSRPTFAEIARDEVENRYNDGDTTFTAAVSIAEAISKAVAHTHGKGNAARYMLDTIAHYVQSHCNPALEEDEEEEPAQPYDLYIDGDCVESFDTLTEARQAYDKAAGEHPDSVIDILSADGETSYIGQN